MVSKCLFHPRSSIAQNRNLLAKRTWKEQFDGDNEDSSSVQYLAEEHK
jgi:hypothetical protein